jgi:4-methyl-5(b-hydroxyethyl)-thiazole monophosphate biosynthesis
MGKDVLVAVADGIEEIETVCIVDTLRRGGASVTVAAVAQLEITASRGVKLVADKSISDCTDQQYNLIALPGGMGGAEYLRDCTELIEMLKAQKQQGKLYAAMCASPAVILSHHGLIDDKKATCHPALADKLVCKEKLTGRVVVDGNCITSQGPGTALEFAIELVRQLFGDERAKQVAGPMLIKQGTRDKE